MNPRLFAHCYLDDGSLEEICMNCFNVVCNIPKEEIEQNPEKPSRWGQLAREGHQVVQFKHVQTNKFVAVSVDGKVRVYGARNGSHK